MESTVGFWYRFDPGSYETLQYGMQASYFLRYDWNGIGRTTGTVGTSGAPHGNDTMIFTSFRYVILKSTLVTLTLVQRTGKA